MLIQYVKTGKGKRVGVVVALSSNKIGYSLCHESDKFDKSRGKFIAEKRAESGKDFIVKLSEIIHQRYLRQKMTSNVCRMLLPIIDMENRAGRYFG